jgi:Uma2 family endonuclease
LGWELHDGRLELVYMPVSMWHDRVVSAILAWWARQGHETGREQRIANSGYLEGKDARNNRVAVGVVFIAGHIPPDDAATHEPPEIRAVIEAVSDGSEQSDAVEKLGVYARLGIPTYWIVRRNGIQRDGEITVYELGRQGYVQTGTMRVAEL